MRSSSSQTTFGFLRMTDPGSFYNDRIGIYGENISALGWRSVEQQEFRFEVLTRGLKTSSLKVLDIGCGFGDMFWYLKKNEFSIKSYTGIDVSSKMVEIASERILDSSANFYISDYTEFKTSTKFDVIFVSGTLNYKTGDSPSERITTLMALSSDWLDFNGELRANFLRTNVDYINSINEHYDTIEVADSAKNFFSKVEVIQNYGLYEFTLVASDSKKRG